MRLLRLDIGLQGFNAEKPTSISTKNTRKSHNTSFFPCYYYYYYQSLPFDPTKWNLTMAETRRITQSFVTQVSPVRMFKALILDSHNICPSLMFSSFKSIEFIEGDGDVGTIKQINYFEDGEVRYTKHRIDALDKDKFMCKFSFIEGNGLMDMLEFFTYEVKFEGYGDRGCVCRLTGEFRPKEGVEIQEIDIELGKDRTLGTYEVVEAHLLAHPQLYAN